MTDGAGKQFPLEKIIFFAGIIVSFLLFAGVLAWEKEGMEREFRRSCSLLFSRVDREIHRNLFELVEVGAFLTAADSVSAEDFRAFTTKILRVHPGLKSVSWLVPAGGGGGKRENISVLYTEPPEASDRVRKEFLDSLPEFSQTLRWAVERGRLTSIIPDGGTSEGTFFVYPVYFLPEGGKASPPRAERIKGFVLGEYDLKTIITRAVDEEGGRGISLSIAGISGEDPAVSGGEKKNYLMDLIDFLLGKGGVALRREINIGGGKWLVVALPEKGVFGERKWGLPLWVLSLSLMTTFFVSLFVHFNRARRRSERAYMSSLERARKILEKEVSERMKAESVLSRELEVSSYIATLSSQLMESLSLERVAHLGLDYARKLTGSTLGFVGFVDSRTGNLVAPVYSGDVWAGGESKTPVFSRERGLIGWILREGKPLIVNDVASDPRFPGVPEGHEAIERLIALPIFSQDELIGIIALANAERDYTNEDRRVLERISSLLSIAVLRLKAEDALASSEKRFRSLVESAHFGTLILRERKVSYMSSALKELFGHVPSPFSFKEIQGIHPEDVERLERVLHRVEEVGIEALDTEFRYFPPSSDGGKRRMKWIYCRLKRVKYEDGTALLLNFIDITKAKEAEMLINDRLMSLGRITAGIAHEIKNPLSGINIYLKALKRVLEEGEDPEKGLYIIEQIRAASERIDSVIRQTMDFSRPTPPRFRPLNLNEAVRGALNLVGGTVKKGGVELETDLAPHLPTCYGDPQLLSQVVMNLVTNAAEAMRNHDGTKKILIRTEAGEETVVLKVSDSGPGIPPENRNRIFEPFFTTKSDTTGLGLSICSRIILDHGGTITVGESEMGGAEFTIEIPLDRRRSRR